MANRKPERLGEFVRRIGKKKGLSLLDVSKHSALSDPEFLAAISTELSGTQNLG